jgi:hypothetical protein
MPSPLLAKEARSGAPCSTVPAPFTFTPDQVQGWCTLSVAQNNSGIDDASSVQQNNTLYTSNGGGVLNARGISNGDNVSVCVGRRGPVDIVDWQQILLPARSEWEPIRPVPVGATSWICRKGSCVLGDLGSSDGTPHKRSVKLREISLPRLTGPGP